jgi:hypothetical protein
MAEIFSTVSPEGNLGTPANTGAQYTGLAAWENAQQTDLTTAANPTGEPSTSVVECYAGDYENDTNGDPNTPLEEQLYINGWTTSEAFRPIVRAAAGSENNGVSINDGGSGFAITNTGAPLRLNEAAATYENIEAIAASGIGLDILAGAAFIDVYGCIITSFNNNPISNTESNRKVRVINCWLTQKGSMTGDAQIYKNVAAGSVFYNNTLNVSTSGRGLEVNANTVQCINNVVSNIGAGVDYGQDASPGVGEFTNNASTDATASGIGNSTAAVDNVSLTPGVDFVDPSSGDYNPVAAGALDGAGTSPPVVAVDIAGATRNDPDEIGVYAIPSAVYEFDGEDIIAQTGTQDVAYTFQDGGDGDVSTRFSAAGTYTLDSGSAPLPLGMSINNTTGNPEGTPTEAGTFAGIVILGTET